MHGHPGQMRERRRADLFLPPGGPSAAKLVRRRLSDAKSVLRPVARLSFGRFLSMS